MKAVTYPELERLTDVIVFSTKGDQSKVSLLSGGDYDGDHVSSVPASINARYGFVGMRRLYSLLSLLILALQKLQMASRRDFSSRTLERCVT